jgi:hypothetical protein
MYKLMFLRDLSHFHFSITKLRIKKLNGTASLALSENVVMFSCSVADVHDFRDVSCCFMQFHAA